MVLWRLCNSDLHLLAIENGIDNLYYLLYGIPGNTEFSSGEPQDAYEKLRVCEQKLVHLESKAANFIREDWMTGEEEKLTELMEKTFGENPQNRNVLTDLVDYNVQEDSDYAGLDTDGVLTREEIKKRSERLVQDKMRIVRTVKKKGRKRYVSKKKVIC
uniref:coiled-coil domain-containing protein 183-like n=1 Tax=Pristiophorus japonicus TaxID=55135 RepID=UPI00398E5AC6